MSLISKALKKTQETRQDNEYPKIVDIVYLTDTPKGIKNASMVLIAVGIIAAIALSIAALTISLKNSESKRAQVLVLEKTINFQEKRIDDFINAINKNQKFTNNQIQDLNSRLNDENDNMKSQISDITSTNNAHYDSLKEAIIDEKQQIDSINKNIQTFNQAKAITTPASGN